MAQRTTTSVWRNHSIDCQPDRAFAHQCGGSYFLEAGLVWHGENLQAVVACDGVILAQDGNLATSGQGLAHSESRPGGLEWCVGKPPGCCGCCCSGRCLKLTGSSRLADFVTSPNDLRDGALADSVPGCSSSTSRLPEGILASFWLTGLS